METRLQNLKDHIARIHSLLAASRGTTKVESTMKPLETRTETSGMSLEQISATRQWKSLSTRAKQVLSLYLRFEDRSLAEAVAIVHPDLSPDVHKQVAENLLMNPDVRTIICLFFGRAQL